MTTSSITSIPTIEQRYLEARCAFDSVADQYRGPLGNNLLVQHMRAVLWRYVEMTAPPAGRLLDLGCGTGHDAVHFLKLGYAVTAIDWSDQMVAQTRQEAGAANVSERLAALNLGMQELNRLSGESFDCIYSDLGALNCAADPAALARQCYYRLKTGGRLVFSVIGRYCPWELAYYGLRGNLARARVRLARQPVPVGLNGGTVWTRYYTPRELHRHFSPFFTVRSMRALNLFLPPPYLINAMERHPSAFKCLAWLDEKFGEWPVLRQAGDHFLIVMSRRD